MKKSMLNILGLAALTIGTCCLSAVTSAGVMVTEKDKGEQSQSLFQNNIVYEIQGGQLIAKFDLARNQCSMYMPQINILAEGDCQDLFDSLDGMKNKAMSKVNEMRDAMMKNLSPEQRKMMQNMGVVEEDSMTLVKADSTTITGYPAQRYDLVKNGNVVYSVWVSKKLRDEILREVDKDKVKKFQAAIGTDKAAGGVSQIDKYVQQLEEDAETMRIVTPDWHNYGGSFNTRTAREVVAVEVKKFNTDQFVFPDGVRKIPADKIGEELAKQMPGFLQ